MGALSLLFCLILNPAPLACCLFAASLFTGCCHALAVIAPACCSVLCWVLLQQHEEEAAAEQLLQLQQQGPPADAVDAQARSVFVDSDDEQQQPPHQQQLALPIPTDTGSTATTPPVDAEASRCVQQTASTEGAARFHADAMDGPYEDSKEGPPQAVSGGALAATSEDDAEEGLDYEELEEWENAYEDELVGAELAEKKWKTYLQDHASPLADFFAGQVRFWRFWGFAVGV